MSIVFNLKMIVFKQIIRFVKCDYMNVHCLSVQPPKPVITGNLDIIVGSSTELICTIPECFNRGPYSYTWFNNKEKMVKENRKTLRLKVTNDLKYNKYSCTVYGNELERKFDRSNPVQINPQCEKEYYNVPNSLF